MKKRFKLGVMTASIFFLTACTDLSPVKPTVEGGSPIRPEGQVIDGKATSVDVVEQNQANLERTNKLKSLISNHFVSLDGIRMIVMNQFTGLGKEIKSESQQMEAYQDGKIGSYFLSTRYQADDEEIATQSFSNGDKTYIKIGNKVWQEIPGDTKGSTLYLHLVKLILEGDETWEFQEDGGSLHVVKTVESEAVLKNIFQLIEIPVFMSPKADKKLQLDYQINEETGEILTAHLLLQVKDLGNEWQVSVRSKSDFMSEVEIPIPDLDEAVAQVDTEASDFATYFKAANPYDVFNYYELYRTDIEGENQTGKVSIGNYVIGEPYMVLSADIEDGSLVNQSLWFKEQQYEMNGDQVKTRTYSQKNYYRYFVDRLIDVYDTVIALEGNEDENLLILREVYTHDFEGFKEAAGGIEVDHLESGTDGTYGVDYYIDAKTQVLTGIYLWASGPEETTVSRLVSINFGNLFENNPNFISHQLDNKIWDRIQSTE